MEQSANQCKTAPQLRPFVMFVPTLKRSFSMLPMSTIINSRAGQLVSDIDEIYIFCTQAVRIGSVAPPLSYAISV